jgi:predicted PurR-regulated permease PerM
MNFPAPSPQQARILWTALTALALGVVLALVGLLCWGVGWLLGRLSSVLLPLAAAGILAYLLDPVVDQVERRLRIPRTRAIVMVFFLAVMFVLILLMTVVPQLVVEIGRLANELPDHAQRLRTALSEALAQSPLGLKAKEAWDAQLGAGAQAWLTKSLPIISGWLLRQAGRVASWAGLLAGVALVPVYLFYFLLEKRGIQRNWTDYLPVRESRLKHEAVFVLSSINDCLIVFFRGQVLVAMCSGTLLTILFLFLGLRYPVLLGVMAGMLGIVPYLGVMISLVPALTLAVVQFADWWHPLLVLGAFGLVQMVEGLFVSPRIIGERVGLHPLTIIIAVMMGTTLLGGILGGLLAIPLTAALRTLMFRYVWKREPRK